MWVTNASGGPWSGNTPTTNIYNSGTNRDSRWNYDASGNLLTLNGNTAKYTAENQLNSLTTTTGATETILYDALGNRVQKAISGGSTTVYVYDAFGLAAEYVGGTWSRDYVKDGGGKLIATENSSGTCTTCYLTYDHLGSVRAVIDKNANVVGRHDYLPFGEEIAASTTGRDANFGPLKDSVTEKFTGQIRDQESGEDYFNARYFTVPLGRFNSPDPRNAGANLLSSQSWNGYAYVLILDPLFVLPLPDGLKQYFHPGASWYDWSPLDTLHVAGLSNGVESHQDLFSPVYFAPLHFLFDVVPSFFINQSPGGVVATYVCSPLGGCYP